MGHGDDVSSDALFQAAEAGDGTSTRRLPKLSNLNAVGGDRRTSVELTSKLQVIQVLAVHGLDPISKRRLAKLSLIKAVGDDRRTSVELTSRLGAFNASCRGSCCDHLRRTSSSRRGGAIAPRVTMKCLVMARMCRATRCFRRPRLAMKSQQEVAEAFTL